MSGYDLSAVPFIPPSNHVMLLLTVACTNPLARAQLSPAPNSEAALKAVKVDPAHCELIATEFDLTKAVAERQLRIHGGDLDRTLMALMGVEGS